MFGQPNNPLDVTYSSYSAELTNSIVYSSYQKHNLHVGTVGVISAADSHPRYVSLNLNQNCLEKDYIKRYIAIQHWQVEPSWNSPKCDSETGSASFSLPLSLYFGSAFFVLKRDPSPGECWPCTDLGMWHNANGWHLAQLHQKGGLVSGPSAPWLMSDACGLVPWAAQIDGGKCGWGPPAASYHCAL